MTAEKVTHQRIEHTRLINDNHLNTQRLPTLHRSVIRPLRAMDWLRNTENALDRRVLHLHGMLHETQGHRRVNTARNGNPSPQTPYSILHRCLQTTLLHIVVEQRTLQFDPLGGIKRSLSLLHHLRRLHLHDRFPESASIAPSSQRNQYKRRFGSHVSSVANHDLHSNPIERDRTGEGRVLVPVGWIVGRDRVTREFTQRRRFWTHRDGSGRVGVGERGLRSIG